jgi:preprotein translocase subunit SecD
MKTIIYALIAIVVFGMFAPKIQKAFKPNQTLTLQAIDNHLSEKTLNVSAAIMEARLKQFTDTKFELTTQPQKHQIVLHWTKGELPPTIQTLLIQKGQLAFYETLKVEELEKQIPNSHQLFFLLEKSNNPFELGKCPLNKVGEVNEYLVKWMNNSPYLFAWGQLSNNAYFDLYALKPNKTHNLQLNNASVKSLLAKTDSKNNIVSLLLDFTDDSQKEWQQITRENLSRSIAITIDNRVIFAPVLQSEIKKGICEITGNFSMEEANYIAALGNNNVLPAAFKIFK